MTEQIRGSSPEGASAIDKVVEITIARLQEGGDSKTPITDRVISDVIDDLALRPDQLPLLLGAVGSMIGAIATFATEQINAGDPVSLVRLTAAGLKS